MVHHYRGVCEKIKIILPKKINQKVPMKFLFSKILFLIFILL